jgi:glycosyltransferase involved in cell wall biosynthesis
MLPDITFVVSAYDRPLQLLGCLAGLKSQTHPNIEIIVTDNAFKGCINQLQNEAYSSMLGVKYINTEAIGCYHSAEIGAEQAQGTFLAFPSDDSLFVPTYAETMLKHAREHDLDLVYSDQLYNGRWEGEPYHVMTVRPRLNAIDKTAFILKRDKFIGFPDKGDGGYVAADGLLIERLVASGIRHGYPQGILSVHN